MISISKLLCGGVAPGDGLRYGGGNRPIVVWNCTRRCNLRCIHCYADSENKSYPQELSTAEARAFIQDLAGFGVPVLLFSGGEPLMRPDLLELARWAKSLGLRVVLSTNGTLITPKIAREIKEIGFGEVGISLDGIGERNDYFRGKRGAFEAALKAIRLCLAEGQRVSLRFTLSRHNCEDLPAIFDLVERENIHRVCFYHLAYSGRGKDLQEEDLTHQETRAAVDIICQRTVDLYRRGLGKEVLTVDNHADGVYLYLKVLKEAPERAPAVLELLRRNGGNSSGMRIGAVDNLGNVHPDQFWWDCSLGNVRQRPFSAIWSDGSEPLLQALRERKKHLKGRCAHCLYLELCNGNLRVRAEKATGDLWAEDPACYLTDEEIGLATKATLLR